MRPAASRAIRAIVIASAVVCLLWAWEFYANKRAEQKRAYWRYQSFLQVSIFMTTRDELLPARTQSPLGEELHSWRLTAMLHSQPIPRSHWPRIEERWTESSFRNVDDLGRFMFTESGQTCTFIMAVVDEDTGFMPHEKVSLKDLPENLIVAVEDDRCTTHWMAPVDLSIATVLSPDRIAKQRGPSFHVLFADGEVRRLRKDIPPKVLEDFLTRRTAKQAQRATLDQFTLYKRGQEG